MEFRFAVEHWAAVAPGIDDEPAWRAWAREPWLPQGDDVPSLPEMPPLQRRRLERPGRMALQAAYRCQPEAESAIAMVFASRHGDIARTHEMLQALACDEALSPTQFGLSTHNAIAAQYSIARALTGNCSVVSAGLCTPEAAVSEALALLADDEPEVLLVMYDVPPPDAYRVHADEPLAPYAWAWRMVRPRPGRPSLSLQAFAPPASAPVATRSLPHGLEVLRFFLGSDAQLLAVDAQRGWCWRRHD